MRNHDYERQNVSMKKLLLTILIIGMLGFLAYWATEKSQIVEKVPEYEEQVKSYNHIQNGDIIFQTSLSSQSEAIQLATDSKYSHMGIIYENDNKWYVFEAVQPVKLTPLEEWISRGENGHYVIKRLRNSEALTAPVIEKMKLAGEKFKGKSYDLYFEWSDERIYCSELVWKIYKEAANIEIGQLEQLSDFDLSSDLVKGKMEERYRDKIPIAEKVISPAAMFNSDKLITVEKN